MSNARSWSSRWPSFTGSVRGGQVAWRVCGRELRLEAGDFCDVVQLRDGSSLAICGDLGGRGPLVASDARTVRNLVRDIARHEVSLTRIVQRLNDRLIRTWADRPQTTFATAAFIRVREAEGGLHVVSASAGHPMPLVLRTDRSLAFLGRPGHLLGVFPDMPVELSHTVLRPGDAIILYTDSVIGGRDPFEGVPSLADLVCGCAGAPAGDIGDCVMLAVAESTTGEGGERAVLVIRAGDDPLGVEPERPPFPSVAHAPAEPLAVG